MRKAILLQCFLVVVLNTASAAGRPNIVLMMADDLGWGDPGFMGNPVIRTPNLDAMAAAGLRFNRFYSAAPVCSPTRGSCLTGRHPYRYGVFTANSGHMPPQELTLAEFLKKFGYRTGHFGKWHLGTLTRTERDSNRGGPRGIQHYSPPQENGFDTCFSTEAKVPTCDPLIKPAGAGGTWWDPVAGETEGTPYGTAYWNEEGNRVEENLRGDDSRLILDRVIPFIRKAVQLKKPFLAVVWFHAPHLPVVAGPKYTKMYAQHPKYHQHYYGCITALDEQVGRLRGELRALGIAKNTLLAFTSDNGPEGRAGKAPGSAGILRGRKRDLFEGGVRVPGLLEWPGRIRPGSVTDIAAITSDYLPTVLDILGESMPDQRPLDGVSLLPLIEGRALTRLQSIGFESGNRLALIDRRYKIVRQGPGGRGGRGKKQQEAEDSFLLFDLIADPGEKKDLAGEHPEIVRRLADTLEAWRRSCKRSLEGKDYRSN